MIGRINLEGPYPTSRVVLENSQGKGTVTYVVLGDSLSSGVGAQTVEKTYPYLVAKQLAVDYQQVELVNLAVPGAVSEDVLNDQLKPALEKNPDYISLLIGINDIHNRVPLADFRQTYQTILESLESKTQAKIVVVNLPYLGSKTAMRFPFNVILATRTREFNRAIRSLVDQHNPRFVLVDLYSVTEEARNHQDYYAKDNFHPSGEGYLFWSKTINVAF